MSRPVAGMTTRTWTPPGRRDQTECRGCCRGRLPGGHPPRATTRALSARPEEARTARRFVREVLTCWGLEALAEDAEMIVDELVVNAVLHGTRAGLTHPGAGASVLRLCLLRRAGE